MISIAVKNCKAPIQPPTNYRVKVQSITFSQSAEYKYDFYYYYLVHLHSALLRAISIQQSFAPTGRVLPRPPVAGARCSERVEPRPRVEYPAFPVGARNVDAIAPQFAPDGL